MHEIRKDREERRLTTVLYVGTVVVMLLLLYATNRNIRKYNSTVDEVRVHNMALLELEGMLSSLRDAETGVRGYLISGDTAFLEPYRLANRRIYDHTARLGLHGLNAGDSAELSDLRRRSAQLEWMWRSMVFNKGSGTDMSATPIDDLRASKALMDSVRAQHDRYVQDRTLRRNALLERERVEGVDAPFMLGIYSLLAIIATALLFWRLTRTLRRKEVVRLALRNKVRDLDSEVAKRTSLQTLLQQVFDVSPSGIMSFRSIRDAQGVITDLEWLNSNRMANELVGRDDLTGRRLLEEMPGNRDAGLFDAYVNTVEKGTPSVMELRYEGEGLDRWFRYHAVKLEDGIMVTFSDVTEQKRAEQVNLESDRLELTAQLMRTVAHEVRNPLTNIHLAIEQVQDEVADRQEATGPYFAIIDRNLKRIGTLIKEMLESARIRELDPAPCALGDIVGDALKAVGDRLALKGMASEAHIPPEKTHVVVDRELLNLAITNIAVNAVEAMEPGKGRLIFAVSRDGDDVMLEIADNGRGIPSENLQRLFEPFYSGRPGGLGLGLTAARNILRGHGIQLDVRSVVGAGSCFILRFPGSIVVAG